MSSALRFFDISYAVKFGSFQDSYARKTRFNSGRNLAGIELEAICW